MDPNETLKRLRAIRAELDKLFAAAETTLIGAPEDARLSAAVELGRLTDEFMELWDALDEWMSKGGFSPWKEADR